MALASTKEKEITVTYEVVVDTPKMVSYVYVIPLLFTQEKNCIHLYHFLFYLSLLINALRSESDIYFSC